MTVFALMDEWLACTGGDDDAWLSLGLDVLDGWQAATRGAAADPATTGQQHLASMLGALRAGRPVAAAPDPVALALWFDTCARLDPLLLDRLAVLAGPALAVRVGRLVRGLAAGGTRPGRPGGRPGARGAPVGGGLGAPGSRTGRPVGPVGCIA